jgi:hypothetical protein
MEMFRNPELLSIIENEEGDVSRLLTGNAAWQSDRAQQILRTERQHQEARRLEEGLGSVVGPPFQLALDQWDEEQVEKMKPYYPPGTEIDPTLARYIDFQSVVGEGTLPGAYGAYKPRAAGSKPSVKWIQDFEGNLLPHPIVYAPGKFTIFGQLGDTPSTVTHEYEHVRTESEAEKLGVPYYRGYRVAGRGLEEAELGSEELYTRLRGVLRAQNKESLNEELNKYAAYFLEMGYELPSLEMGDALTKTLAQTVEADKLDSEEKQLKILGKLLPEFLSAHNLPTNAKDWIERNDRVVVSPLVSSLLSSKKEGTNEKYEIGKWVKEPVRTQARALIEHEGYSADVAVPSARRSIRAFAEERPYSVPETPSERLLRQPRR